MEFIDKKPDKWSVPVPREIIERSEFLNKPYGEIICDSRFGITKLPEYVDTNRTGVVVELFDAMFIQGHDMFIDNDRVFTVLRDGQ